MVIYPLTIGELGLLGVLGVLGQLGQSTRDSVLGDEQPSSLTTLCEKKFFSDVCPGIGLTWGPLDVLKVLTGNDLIQ